MLPQILCLVCPGFFLVHGIWAQAGHSDKPSLSAWPSTVVPTGKNLTLHCESQLGFEMFKLFKEDGDHILKIQHIESRQSFVMGPVTAAHAGVYRCQGFYSKSTFEPSAPSDALAIMVTGVYRKPSIWALPDTPVKSGAEVILQCSSDIEFETFILVVQREGVKEDYQHLVGESYDGCSQANISITSVTAAHAGTYRCYGSSRHQPYEWSEPSDPLDIKVTVPGESPEERDGLQIAVGDAQLPSCSAPPFDLPLGPGLRDYTLGNSIRMGVAGLVLLALLTMLAEAWWNREEPEMPRRKLPRTQQK